MTFVGGAQGQWSGCVRRALPSPPTTRSVTVGASLVYEIGGQPVRIDEADRTLYHAALAHGANHLVALISDATTVLRSVIERADADGTAAPLRSAQDMLAPLVTAALGNVLDLGPSALTGPVARGDADAVAAHLAALREWGASARRRMRPSSTPPPRAQAARRRARRPAPALARVLGEAS